MKRGELVRFVLIIKFTNGAHFLLSHFPGMDTCGNGEQGLDATYIYKWLCMLFEFHSVRVSMRLIKVKDKEKLLTVSFYKKKS